jgi:hypothetical protein
MRRGRCGAGFQPGAIVFSLAVSVFLAGCHSKDRFLGSPPTTPYSYHGDIGATSAIIAWRTDSPASSLVEYGPDERYGSSAGNPAERVQFHRVPLSGLSASSFLHCRVKSLDDPGNTVYSYDQTFRTFPSGVAPGSYHRFDDTFDNQTMYWTIQTYTDSRGVIGSEIVNTANAHSLPYCLKMDFDLVASDPHLGKGEMYLESAGADDKAGDGVSVNFQDMTGKTLSAWIVAPYAVGKGVCKDGPTNYGNFGVQLFVKDVFYRSQYGPWTSMHDDPFPFQVTMGVGGGGNAYTDAGFDARAVALVGVKVAPPGDPSTVPQGACTYTGWVYVDDVAVTP